MMNKSRLNKLMALVLCLVLLATTVSASGYTLDLSGDGLVNVWDMQVAVNENKEKAHQEAILTGILGNPDELHPNAEGVYEIHTATGLYNMAKHASEGASFKLMNDIDMQGAHWLPVEKFRGTFDGQGYTISNVNITQCGEGTFQGFFATVDYDANRVQSVVKDLNLYNVRVVAAEKAEFIGLFAGQIRGIVQDCTVTGFVTDSRTNLTKSVYIGSMAGRINNSNPDGILKYTKDFNNFLTVSSGAVGAPVAGDSVDGITTKMGMDFAPLAEGSKTRTFGLYGAVPSAESLIDETGKVTWNWQDITNSTEYAPKELQERRKIAAQYMYDMGMVYWTPSQNLMIINYKAGAGDRTSTKYSTTNLYRGIPYNHGSSSLDRFNYWVNNPALPTDAFYITDDTVVQQFNDALLNNTYIMYNDRKTLTTITGDTGWKWTNLVNNYMPTDWTVEPTVPSVTSTYLTGFGRYIGNDCSSAAAWAWRNISAVYNDSQGCARPNNTNNMFPSPRYMYKGTSDFTGIVPVNGLTFADPMVTNSSGQLVKTTSSLEYAKMINAEYDADPNKFLEAYTHASMADCLMGYQSAGGHTLMLMGDAVTIRSKTGKILPDVSYVVTTEQGGGGSSGTRESDGKAWTSTWSVNRKRSFATLLRYDKESVNTEERYFPITIAALREVDTPAATAWCKLNKGEVTSNFHIVSTQVGDELVYTKTTMTSSRTSCISVKLADFHTVTTGTVTVLLANGQTYTFNN